MEIVVTVMHEGDAKMTGKCFPIGPRGRQWLIFWHQETRPTQWHRKLDSPGGVDLCVLDYLDDVGVAEVHHQRVTYKDTLVAPLDMFHDFGIVQVSGGRRRCFLPYVHWETYHAGDTTIDYIVPWIEAKIVLDPAPITLPRTRGSRVQRGTGIVYQHPLPGF